jgi:diaphanous 1
MKPFFWTKLQVPAIQSTVWGDIPSDMTFDMEDLEATFTIDNAPASRSKVTLSTSKNQAPTTLLDITRAQNVAIMLSRIKLSFSEIRHAILEVNDQQLSMDELKAIAKQLPTTEEVY